MKSININTTIIVVIIFFYLLTSCERTITDYGNDRTLSGMVKDQSGNIVHGNITRNDISVMLLGKGETLKTFLRVDGEGMYQNTKLFSQVYKAWIEGPVFWNNPSDTITLDFINNQSLVQHWVVIPYFSFAVPEIVSGPTASSVKISYSITGNNGKIASRREIYCSTSPYPDTARGSGYGYQTVKMSLTNNSDVVSVKGLKPDTKYYVRISASADGGTTWNYSGLISFTTPLN